MAESGSSQGLARSLGDALATPALRRLQIAWAASATASWGFAVALSVYAYRNGGATAVALAALAHGLPAGLLAPVAGLLADRHSRRQVMLATAVCRAVILVGTAAAVYLGAPLAVVLVLAGLVGAAGVPHKPAQAAMLPSLAETPRQLAAANVVWNTIESAGFLVGALVGGLLVAATSAESVFLAMAATFLVAAFLLLRLPRDPVPENHELEEDSSRVKEAALGFREIASNPGTRLIVTMLTAAALVEGAVEVLIVLLALQLLDLGGAGVGLLSAGWGLGGVLGGVLTLSLLARGRLAERFVAGGAVAGLAFIAIAAVPVTGPAILLLVLGGVGYALVELPGLTLLQRLTPNEVLARVFAAVESAYWVAGAVGALSVPLIVAAFGVRGALVAIGAFLPLLVLLRFTALNRFESAVEIPERPYRVLRALPLFAPLPLVTVETVALRATEVRVRSGEVVITEGEPGEAFYAIEEGALDPACEGGAFPRMHAGDFFGEIALLRDMPRTATVTACADSVLFEVDREAFLMSVTGQRRSVSAAQSVADVRLERVPVPLGGADPPPTGR
jgi:MFS family permease